MAANLHSAFDIELGADSTGSSIDFKKKLAEADYATALTGTKGQRIALGDSLSYSETPPDTLKALYVFSDRAISVRVTIAATERTIPVTSAIGTRTYKFVIEGVAVTAFRFDNASGATANIDFGYIY